MRLHAFVNEPTEWSMTASRDVPDPFNTVDLDVVLTAPSGRRLVAPAFWGGGREWRVRVAADEAGEYRWRSEARGAEGVGLDGLEGELVVSPYTGTNPLYRHGALRVARSGRSLEHADGAPFFWLADTWWMGLCKRLGWPGDFQWLVSDRVEKGYTVIQIVAGLYPDMDAFDDRGRNEAGFPWEPGWTAIRPEYFDAADARIHWLVRSGLVPCIVGCWGYYLGRLGVEKMKRHWRYLVARWGAYPVTWCLAGEVLMPYYLDPLPDQAAREAYAQEARTRWSEIARYVRSIDPYGRLMTAHPGDSARASVDDDVLDFDMLQTGHGDRTSLPNTVEQVVRSYSRRPVKPVIDGEVCYEGIGEASRQEVQRMMFWVCMLSGACGHTYGANGIWQVNGKEQPYGPSPHGMAWGDTPWEEACRLPGGAQVGIGKRLLDRYEWWRFEPHPEWVEPHWTPQNYMAPYAAGIPGRVRVVYCPTYLGAVTLCGLEAGVEYRAYLFDPKNGRETEAGIAVGDAEGRWRTPHLPIYQDWVVVAEKR